MTPEEIAEEVLSACELGITMVHLHARDTDGLPSCRAEAYAEIIERIRAVDRDLVICVSTSGRKEPEFQARSEVLDLSGDAKPDMASLTPASMNFAREASLNAPDMVKALATRMQERGILPEIEIFDLGMANYLGYLGKRGLVKLPCYVNLLLGNVASAQANLMHAGLLVRELPAESVWSMGGIGNAQLVANGFALAAGGGVRVGLEDNLYFDSARKRLASNGELLRRVLELGAIYERVPMKPQELRTILGISTL